MKTVEINVSKHIPKGARVTHITYSGDETSGTMLNITNISFKYEYPDIEILPLSGIIPTIKTDGNNMYYAEFGSYSTDKWYIVSPSYHDQTDCIIAWNNFVKNVGS